MALLKETITEDMKAALRSRESERLGALRLLLAAIKQREVDERSELTDTDVLAVIDKMLKQRRDSISQFQAAGRQDLVDKEQFEISVLQAYMPKPLSSGEIDALIDDAIRSTGAVGMKDMGKAMSALRPSVAGRADMGDVSARLKARLTD